MKKDKEFFEKLGHKKSSKADRRYPEKILRLMFILNKLNGNGRVLTSELCEELA